MEQALLSLLAWTQRPCIDRLRGIMFVLAIVSLMMHVCSAQNTRSNESLWEVQSCRNHCEESFAACACDEKCLVHQNCCEDFEIECPQVARESREKFSHMFSVRVVCDDNVLVVSSCPSNNSEFGLEGESDNIWNITNFQRGELGGLLRPPNYTELDSLSISCWNETLELQSYLSESASILNKGLRPSKEKDASYNFLVVLSQRRITDRVTGFVYADANVFQCNARQESVPCLWGLQVKADLSDEPVGEEKDIARKPVNLQFTPIPPKEKVIPWSSVHKCYPTAKDDCDRNSTYFSEELRAKCLSFTSLVQSKTNGGNTQLYRNRFCLECNEGSGSPYIIFIGKNRFHLKYPELSTLLSLTNQLAELSNDLKFGMVGQRSSTREVSWSTAVCKFEDTVICELVECNNGLIKRPDGRCKSFVHLHLAVRLLGRQSLDPEEHQKLAHFLLCTLRSQLRIDVEEESSAQTSAYHLPNNTTMFGAIIGAYISFNAHEEYDTVLSNLYGSLGARLAEVLSEELSFRLSLPTYDYQSSFIKSRDPAETIFLIKSFSNKQPVSFSSVGGNHFETSYDQYTFCACVSSVKDVGDLVCSNGIRSNSMRDKITVGDLQNGPCFKRFIAFSGCEQFHRADGMGHNLWTIILCGIQQVVCTYFTARLMP